MQDARTILVVDDDSVCANILAYTLVHAGFAVRTERNGLRAWEHLQARDFDAVIVDEAMPEMTGSQLCRKIRSDGRWPDLLLLMVTQKIHELDVAGLKSELGIREILGKPFSSHVLVSLLEEALAGAPATG